VDGLISVWTLALGLPALALHVLAVTLARALRTYSPSRLEELCALRGRPARAVDVAQNDLRTERAAESFAVLSGLMLAALLGVASDRLTPRFAGWAVLVVPLGLGAVGYVVAGVVGRVFAERVIDTLWPAAAALRFGMGPLTYGIRRVESFVEEFAGPPDAVPRPASVEVEFPADADLPDDAEPDLPGSARELLEHAVALTRRDVAELMTPRSLSVTLPSTVAARDAARTFVETGKSRIPLYGENRDDIVGVLYAKDLFPRLTEAADPATVVPRQLARPAYCVPETKNAYELLEEFRAKRTQMAIVLDEYGGVAGLITLEDLLEDLVGAIDDEHDVPTPDDPVVPLGGSRYEVDATVPLDELNERLSLRLPTDADFETLGGFALHALGRLPEPGASFHHEGVEFQVAEVSDHSIRRVRIDLQPAEAVER
jgi:CBS domain containing-hemolysin-like protein